MLDPRPEVQDWWSEDMQRSDEQRMLCPLQPQIYFLRRMKPCPQHLAEHAGTPHSESSSRETHVYAGASSWLAVAGALAAHGVDYVDRCVARLGFSASLGVASHFSSANLLYLLSSLRLFSILRLVEPAEL